MKRLMSVIACLLASIFIFASCASSDPSKEEKVYLQDSEITQLFTDPDAYKGKYVKLVGKVSGEVDKSGDTTCFQAYYDFENYNYTYLVYTNQAEAFKDGDYVIVDGRIDGDFDGETVIGTELHCPMIKDASVTKSDYLTVAVPTLKEITPNVSQEQKGFKITLNKVEYAEKETRMYFSATNSTSQTISFGAYDIKLLMEGQQIARDDNSDTIYNANLTELPYEVSAGATAEGVAIFPAIKQDTNFQVLISDIFSDDYEVDYSNMTLDVIATSNEAAPASNGSTGKLETMQTEIDGIITSDFKGKGYSVKVSGTEEKPVVEITLVNSSLENEASYQGIMEYLATKIKEKGYGTGYMRVSFLSEEDWTRAIGTINDVSAYAGTQDIVIDKK